MSGTWWKHFPGPPDRLLVYFSTHHLLYVPSLSFGSDKEQTRAIDHDKSTWIIRGARGLMGNFKIWSCSCVSWKNITKWSILQHQDENADYFDAHTARDTTFTCSQHSGFWPQSEKTKLLKRQRKVNILPTFPFTCFSTVADLILHEGVSVATFPHNPFGLASNKITEH